MQLLSFLARKLKNRVVQVVIIIAAYFLFADFLPLYFHQTLFTISTFIKDLLIWILPITVGFFIANTVCSFEKKAPIFVIFILLLETLSNLTCVFYAYFSGHVAVDHLPPMKLMTENYDFNTLWNLPFLKPSWWSSDKGVIVGLLLGCYSAFSKSVLLRRTIQRGKEIAQWVLTNFFSRLIPVFILGFIAKMHQTKMLNHVFANYSVFLVWLVMLLVIYLSFLFLLGSGFSPKVFFRSIKNLLPAGGIAFSSSSSISTMPWTIEGTAKNLKNPDYASAVIPATTNIQQVGDCITNTFLCFLIYYHFNGHCPDIMTWLNFSLIFVLARFATAAILGGAIFIMLPIYETYLSFSSEMIAIILAFNVILDPIITCFNVVGNGAMCSISERIWNSFFRKTPETK